MGMQRPQSSSSLNSFRQTMEASAHVRADYVEPTDLPNRLTTSDSSLLGVVSFGTALPYSLPCPMIELALPQLDGPRLCEIWTSDQPVRHYREGAFSAAVSGDVVFASISVPELPDSGLNQITQAAYRHLLQQLRELGFPYLWRIWNFFPRMNDEQDGLERYRQFCIGRHHALAGSLADFPGSLPAGTAVGTASGPLQIYLLAGVHPATHLGNPRQLDAYDYPKTYGPCSPSFARATLQRSEGHTQLFIAGTSSVVGHESQHPELPDRQSRETVENIRALIDHAERTAMTDVGNLHRQSSYKVYVRNPGHLNSIRQALHDPLLTSSPLLFLQGDLCRKELLVEIEGLITTN